MDFRRLAKILCVTIIALTFVSAPLYAAPKGDKGNKGKANAPGQSKAKAQPKGLHTNPPSAAKAKTPLPHLQHKRSVARNQAIKKEKSASLTKMNRPQIRTFRDQRIHNNLRNQESAMLKNLNKSLRNLENARWAYHPIDTRRQGNMGKVDMLDPFGHDKDSDRKELYGNRGRVIKETAPEPEPEPEPDPIPEPEPDPIPEPDPVPEPEPDPIPEPEPEPDPVPEPEPEPEPEPPQEPPDFPF